MEQYETYEKTVRKFLNQNKTEIPDKGFSQKVMKNLPVTDKHDWIVWTFAVIGLSISVGIAFYSGFIQNVFQTVQQAPFYYFAGAVFCFPFIAFFVLCKMQFCKLKIV